MTLKTNINPRYLIRLGIVGIMCTGMCLYCIYDGKVAYPAQRERALAYQEFEKENSQLGQLDLFKAWKVYAAERDWDPGVGGTPITPYGVPKKEYQFNQQFGMAAITGLIGMIFLYKLLSNRGCWIEADDKKLRSSEKREVPFDAIEALDKKLWSNKGIAKVLYQDQGKQQKIVLDDCNYERDSTQEILRHVEANIDPAKIVNGKPETLPEEDATQDEGANES